MPLLRRIRRRNQRVGVRFYNQLRLTLTFIGPIFALVGFGQVFSLVPLDLGRVLSGLLLILLGVAFSYLRYTVFREKRSS